MKIRCKLERKGGSHVTIGGAEYHFTPVYPGGPHVAEVADKQHIGRLLSISEAYEVADDQGEPEKIPAPPATVGASSTLPPDGKPIPMDDSLFRKALMDLSEEELIANYGRKTRYGIPIDKRHAKETMVDLILESLPNSSKVLENSA